jgi:hypothetical protein
VVSVLYIKTVQSKGVAVTDLFTESLALQRIDLFARLVAHVVDSGDCTNEDMEVALVWIAELTTDLARSVDESEKRFIRREKY